MPRLRRATALAVAAFAALPAAADAAVTCPAQTGVNAWAGSPKTVTFAPCTSDIAAPITYTVVVPLATKGTASTPAVNGSTFVFTGTFNPNGSDPVGADSVTLSASDGSLFTGSATVPVSIGAAPVIDSIFTGKDVETDTPLQDGRRTYDVFYKTSMRATSNLSDPTPGTPLAAFSLRFRSGLGINRSLNTNSLGNAVFTFKPLVSDEYDFDVPTLPGTFHDGFVLWVAPDWKIAKTFPVKHRKYVISGRLLANKSARTKGSVVRFQRLKGKKWITVISKVPVAKAMTFTVKISRATYSGKTVRFLYVSKTQDYIGSSFRFTIKSVKAKSLRTYVAGTRSLHR